MDWQWQFSGGELAREILLRLPVKSVLRFRCVCRHWLNLTTDPDFMRSHVRHHRHPAIAGFIEFSLSPRPPNGFRSYSVSGPSPSLPDPFLSLITSEDGGRKKVFVEHSSNGLFLYTKCPFYPDVVRSLYVSNPATMKQHSIPYPAFYDPRNFGLAFDPSRSPLVYSVVCMEFFMRGHDLMLQIWIYSSKAVGSWRRSGKPFQYKVLSCFDTRSVTFSGGALHWMLHDPLIFVFHVKDERWHTTALPCAKDSYRRHRQLGELQEGVHYFEYIYHLHSLTIFRMKEDYAGWSVVCRLHLNLFSKDPSPCLHIDNQEEEEEDEDDDGDGDEDRRNHLLFGRRVNSLSSDFKKKKKSPKIITGLLPFLHPAFRRMLNDETVVPCAHTFFSP